MLVSKESPHHPVHSKGSNPWSTPAAIGALPELLCSCDVVGSSVEEFVQLHMEKKWRERNLMTNPMLWPHSCPCHTSNIPPCLEDYLATFGTMLWVFWQTCQHLLILMYLFGSCRIVVSAEVLAVMGLILERVHFDAVQDGVSSKPTRGAFFKLSTTSQP